MIIFLLSLVVAAPILAKANNGRSPFASNLAFRSPFPDKPELGYDIDSLHSHFTKRDSVVNNHYDDEHYPTWYGADFSNSPFVYSGGINFTHGVASGDPYSDSVLLWTRAVPIGSDLPDASVPVCVSYTVWGDDSGKSHFPRSGPGFGSSGKSKAISSGTAFTSYDVDWTVKIEVDGLQPDTKYTYQFADCTNKNTVSVIGKTRTVASPFTPANQVNGGKPLTFAVFSCSNYPSGYFNAYTYAALNTSSDIFVHLGDYIYEYKDGTPGYGEGAGIGRVVSPNEAATLVDYRTRLSIYRSDSGLQLAHQNHPWIVVWDDHDVADNTWKAGSSDSNDTAAGCVYDSSGTCFSDRKMNAIRAYHEWLPIRQINVSDNLRIWRNFQIGELLDLTMLDTRHYDRDLTDLYYNTEYVNTIAAYGNRSNMGFPQEKWFFDTLSQSAERKATWRIIGQQVVFSQLNLNETFDLDAWDGYRAQRERVLNYLYKNHIQNTIILSGDSHANWVSDLAMPNDTTNYNSQSGNGAIGVEFAGTAVTSPTSFPVTTSAEADFFSSELVGINPDLQWSEGFYRGFFTLEVSPSEVIAQYFAMNDLSTPNTDAFSSANFTVKAGQNRLTRPVAGGSVAAGALRPQSGS